MTKSSLILLAIVGWAAACAPESRVQTNRAPTPEQPAAQVTNAFAPAHGDVRAATAQAVARLASSPSLVTTPIAAPATPASGTLVLYDETGEWGWLGELYAINIASLVSHFGAWTAKPVSKYVQGDVNAYAGVVYVGSTFDEPLPTALLDDVLATTHPVVWIDDNIWQLAARSPTFATKYGFDPWTYDTSDVAQVVYKSTPLTRYLPDAAGIMSYATPPTASVLGQAVRADGTAIPWAVQGKNLFYIGENPMSYVTANDRYLAFCDILFAAFAPATVERHRALVRIEDVDATADPASLRAIADYLSAQKIPFSVAVIPVYLDPNGYYNDGVAQRIPLAQAPKVVSALTYMTTKGGTLLMHGYTHQYSNVANPYSGVSADDFEFYRAHIDASNFVVYDGPVAEDTPAWAAARITNGLAQMAAARLPKPTIFEFPHYAASAVDSVAARASFATAYQRGLYFGGQLAGTAPNVAHTIGVMFPFGATDIFGFKIIPETMGSYEPDASNNNPPRVPADLIATSHANRVIRDGFASFYFHPYYDISFLKQIVAGVKAEGYSFVAATSL